MVETLTGLFIMQRMVDDEGFFEYLSNEQYVAYPWSMIDKITPRPMKGIEDDC